MRIPELLFTLVLLGIGIAVYYLSSIMPAALDGTMGQAVFPKGIAFLLIVSVLLFLYRRFRNLEQAPAGSRKYPSPTRALTLIAVCVAYAASMHFVGYIAASIAGIVVTMLLFKVRSVPVIALNAVCFTVVAYALFQHFLGLELPSNVFF